MALALVATLVSTLEVADAAAAGPPPPRLGARAAALIDESSGQQLYGLNANAEVAIASTTKLMTALVTLHHARLRDMFTDPDFIPAAEDSQIHLEPGERMSVHDLLIALMLPSADDAAEDLAFNVGHGSVSRFVAMMNARAHELRPHPHALLDADRARYAGQLLERRRSREARPVSPALPAIHQGRGE